MIGYTQQDLLTIPNLINKIIQNQINQIHTCFIAKIVSISEDKTKVSVINCNKYVFGDEVQNSSIINDCLVAIPYANNLNIFFPLGVGDFGICVVCESDINSFKQTGDICVPASKRKFNINDSIFIPLSLKNSKIDNEFKISYKENTNIIINDDSLKIEKGDKNIEITDSGIKITSDSDILLEAENVIIQNSSSNPLEFSNQIGSIKDALDAIVSMLDLLSQGMKGAGTNPAAYEAGKNVFIQKIGSIVK